SVETTSSDVRRRLAAEEAQGRFRAKQDPEAGCRVPEKNGTLAAHGALNGEKGPGDEADIMASEQIGSVIHSLTRLFGTGTVAALSELQLLDRFLESRDQAAFEAIVRRHGPMVLGVCRRVLDDPNDVDDAFQATFLILVKKARSIRGR